MNTQLELVTPDLAKSMLEKNVSNRPINNPNVDQLVAEIGRGNFHQTGESIKFAKDGSLLDGQHRLLAIIKSQTPVELLVVRGLDNESFKYMDTGRVRMASDVLAIEGIENSAKLAAMINFIIGYDRGVYGGSHRRKRGSGKITNAMVVEYAQKHLTSLKDSYGFGWGKGKHLIGGTMIASLHYIFKQIHEGNADDFINKLVDGTNLTKGSPIFLLRERFIHDSKNKRKMQPAEKVGLICKAWNLYRKGEPVKVLRWDMGKEAFPKPI